MKYSLKSDFESISFHDSRIVSIHRHQQSVEITFDWAYIDSFSEDEESKAIVISKCKFTLTGVSEEVIRTYNNSTQEWTENSISKEFEQNFKEIGENFIEGQTYIFTGFYTPNKETYWAEWLLHFRKLSLEWNSHISHKDWLNGKQLDKKA